MLDFCAELIGIEPTTSGPALLSLRPSHTEPLQILKGITQPTLIMNGDNDTMIPTVNSYILGEHIPNARVRIFQDAGHGFPFQ